MPYAFLALASPDSYAPTSALSLAKTMIDPYISTEDGYKRGKTMIDP